MSDDLLICPYNKSHEIQPHKMQAHLIKCRKQYPNVKLNQCPFNSNHLLRKEDFQHHKETCADREAFNQLVNQLTVDDGDLTQGPTYDFNPLGIDKMMATDAWEDEDIWAEEVKKGSVQNAKTNPKIYCLQKDVPKRKETKNSLIVRSNIGMTNAEKKKFREEERQRYQNAQ